MLSNEEKSALYKVIIEKITKTLQNLTTKQEKFDIVIKELSNLPHFQWTGIYEYDEPKAMLTLYPVYIGLPTDHIKIQKGQGVCGTAVETGEDIIVKDVTKLDNYLACSTQTKSEIVVLLKDKQKILGQIDVDSDVAGAFSEIDRQYLNQIADLLVRNLN
ncbi:hypothetical protein NEF87_001654 [Candidatus Lokiarchaeum ossiferum]|uniref:GAF domain-containing protein n=1 Tax=Candidatus Lokiarchaeum ossiferum TaxID=2951803 RepID=A0ABY6HPD3_9ARCH|nr:hypothetical protein NEF87_001654 [Candidatus Lokiarchaeum sp. B-35]